MRSGNGGIKILYADDECFLHDPFKLYMEKDGEFLVDAVDSANKALERLSSGHYDAVVSDYQMPGMDGIEFLKHLRSIDRKIPFILFTGRGREEVAIEAINSGADFYLQKGGDISSQFAELTHFIKGAVESREAEEELVAMERKLASFFAHTADAIILFDGSGNVLNINAAAEQLFGATESELAGRRLTLRGEGATARFDEIFRRTVEKGTPMSHDEVLERSDGGRLYLSVSMTPIRDASGGVAFVACTIRDVTDKTRSQALVRAIRDTSIAVLRERPLDGILSYLCGTVAEIFQFRGVGVFLKENDGSLRLLSRAENMPEFGMEKAVRWDDSPGGRTLTGSAVRTGRIRVGRIDDPDCIEWKDIAGKDGYDSVISIPIVSGNQTIGAMTVVGSDLRKIPAETIGQLENAAEAISIAIQSSRQREKQKLLEAALESASDTVVLTDKEGIIEWANHAFTLTTGYTLDEVKGRTPRVLKSGKHDATFYQNLWNTILSGKVFHAKLTNRRKNGELYIEDTVITPVKNENNTISNFIAIKRDITEQMRIDDELRKSEERYRTMLEGIGETYFEVDLKGNLTLFNDTLCGITGYSREELAGMNYTNYVSTETAERLYQVFHGVFLTGKPETGVSCEILGKNGKARWVEVSIQLMKDKNGKPEGFRGLVREMTAGCHDHSKGHKQ